MVSGNNLYLGEKGEYEYELRKKKLCACLAACMAWLMGVANDLCGNFHGPVLSMAKHKNVLGLVECCRQYCSNCCGLFITEWLTGWLAFLFKFLFK